MATKTFQESEVKKTIRLLIRDAAESLQRPELTYMGMPAELGLDVLTLRKLLKNVICIADKPGVLEEARRNIASVPLKTRRFVVSDVWKYMQNSYSNEPLTSDVTFLDFFGGGINKQDPFASELAGLRSYFAKQAAHANRAFVLAWTYMPRDKGKDAYLNAVRKVVSAEDFALLGKTSSGMHFRSLAIRMLLRQSLREHDMQVKVFQHAVYKGTMNALILIYSKGTDPNCKVVLDHRDSLLSEPCCVYTPGQPTPKFVNLLNA